MGKRSAKPDQTKPEPNMAQLTIAEQTQRNLRWNLFVNGFDLVFFTLALSLVSRETVMPVLVSSLTDSKLAIGLIPAIFSLGFYLPQLLVANFSERLRYKKPFVMLCGGLGERGAYLFIGLAVWFWAVSAPQLTLVLFFFFLALGAGCSGAATPAWYDMIAKVIPVHRRGIWSGVSHSLGAFAAVGGALLVGYMLENIDYAYNFAAVFLLAFAALVLSFVGLALNREPPSEVMKERIPLSRYLRLLPTVLRNDVNYRRFLLSRTTIQLGAMATGFFAVYGQERFRLSGEQIGTLTASLVASQAVMNIAWGWVGDRFGHKLVLASAPVVMALAILSTWTAPDTRWLYLTFVMLGAYLAADNVSAFNIIVEFAPPADRPTYIGLTNTLLAPILTVGPLLGAWLATVSGYSGLFGTALAITCCGGLLMALWVREPRKTLAFANQGADQEFTP
jgi:MFS family permease